MREAVSLCSTLSFPLSKISCLYIPPPGISPLPHLCELVPAAGPAKAAQSVSGERRSKILKVICRAALRQIPLDSREKKVMCLRKGKYHRDLHWAESCVLLLGGQGQPEEAVWWEMHSRDTQKEPELLPLSATEHPAHHNLHKHHSLLQALSHGLLEAAVRNESLSDGLCPQECNCRGWRLPKDSH